MNRRQLLTALTALASLSLVPAHALQPTPANPHRAYAKPTGRRFRWRRSMVIQQSPLAGFQYHQGERLWPKLREGQHLQLIREPANTYDPKAVRVDWRGHKLGYLPRLENHAAAQMLDRGQPLYARITRLARSRNPWNRIKVEVLL